jgi:hypothetical protein
VTERPDLRASDEQRDRAAAEIRDHFAAGRLTEDELNERLDAVYRARTQGELRELRRDLPAAPADARAELKRRRTELRREVLQQTGGSFAPFLICTLIWVLAGANGYFWPAWVALGAVIVLARNLWRLYGPAPELDEIERDLEKRRRERRRAR